MGSELGMVLAVPHITGRQRHRANSGPENPDPEVYYRINLALPRSINIKSACAAF